MPTIIRTTTFAAAGTNPNVNTGSTYETARRPQALTMAIVQSITANFAGINIGPETIAEEFEPPVLTTYPVVPDMFYFTDLCDIGDRIVIFVRATVAVVFRSIVILADR